MKQVIATAIKDTLGELGFPDVAFTVSHPSDLHHGDFACNVALVLASDIGQPPRVIAEQIAGIIAGQIEYVDRVEVAGPGFLNFYLTRDFFTAEIARAREMGDAWGTNKEWAGKRIVVEYTDPNPFKEFHIGHLFTNSVGESIARLAMMQGAEVKRVNYQGDVGLHVAHAIYGMQALGISTDSAFTAKDLGRAYAYGANAYKEGGEPAEAIRALNKKIYDRTDDGVNALYDAGRAISLAYFETIYKVIDTQFDEYFFESETGPKGKELVLAHPEVFTESEGAHVFQGEKYGLHTRVFLNKEGLPTYEAKELALANEKAERLGGYDHSIISTSNEITEYFKVLKMAMSFVYPELAMKTEHIGHGTVRLATGKMSSRTGDVIPALEFIQEIAETAHEKIVSTGFTDASPELSEAIALGAIKYATLRGSILQDSVFDKERALSFEGDSGPYLMYTHARIVSVLEKAEVSGVSLISIIAPEEAYEVEKLLYRFEEVVTEAWNERAPHKVVGYLTELAGSFNTFYAHEKIADATDTYAPYKAMVADAVRLTLKNGLWALAIKAPERM